MASLHRDSIYRRCLVELQRSRREVDAIVDADAIQHAVAFQHAPAAAGTLAEAAPLNNAASGSSSYARNTWGRLWSSPALLSFGTEHPGVRMNFGPADFAADFH